MYMGIYIYIYNNTTYKMLAQIWCLHMPTLSVYTGIHTYMIVAQVVNNMAVYSFLECKCKI